MPFFEKEDDADDFEAGNDAGNDAEIKHGVQEGRWLMLAHGEDSQEQDQQADAPEFGQQRVGGDGAVEFHVGDEVGQGFEGEHKGYVLPSFSEKFSVKDDGAHQHGHPEDEIGVGIERAQPRGRDFETSGDDAVEDVGNKAGHEQDAHDAYARFGINECETENEQGTHQAEVDEEAGEDFHLYFMKVE